jgi:predicted RNA-binding protein associated with RNAse of E/G family
VAPAAFVSVVPPDAAYVATFYAPHPTGPGEPVELYVDITTVPAWADGPPRTVSTVDLDLDVVRGRSGRVWVDDEDEFADHRVRYDYPAEMVALATRSCDRVHAAVRAGTGPFDPALGRAWLSRVPAAAAS